MKSQSNTIESLVHSVLIKWGDYHQDDLLPDELVSIIREHLNYAYVRGHEDLHAVIKSQVLKHRNSNNRAISSSYVIGLCDGFRENAMAV